MKETVKETLGEYVTRIMKEKGLSPEQVNKQAGGKIAEGYVRGIMTERANNPSVRKLQALAHGLNVSENELFRIARGLPVESAGDEQDAPDYREIINLLHASLKSRALTRLLHEAAKLSPEAQQEAVILLEMLNERGRLKTRRKKTQKPTP